MKVLFVNPATRAGTAVLREGRCQIRLGPGLVSWPPLRLATLAALVRAGGHAALLLDAPAKGLSFPGAVRVALHARPDAIVLQGTTPTVEDDLAFCRTLKASLPGLQTILFGTHATALPEEVVTGGADFAVVGEPEQTVAELVDQLASGQPGAARVAGICFRRQGQPRLTAARPALPELDRLPLPAWDLVDLASYRMPLRRRPFGIVEVSRGCPYGCVFCTAALYHGKRWRAKTPGRVVEEIASLRQGHGVEDFLLLADTFNFRKAHVLELCSRIAREQPGIHWVCNSRVDLFDEETAAAMRRAGCWLVSFGIETGSPDLLRAAGKRQNLEQAARAVRIAARAGLLTYGYYLFGLPGETPGTLLRTWRLSTGLGTDLVKFYTATPFPGTALYEWARKNRYLRRAPWDRFFHGTSNVLRLPGLSFPGLPALARLAHGVYYLRPRQARKLLALSLRWRSEGKGAPISCRGADLAGATSVPGPGRRTGKAKPPGRTGRDPQERKTSGGPRPADAP